MTAVLRLCIGSSAPNRHEATAFYEITASNVLGILLNLCLIAALGWRAIRRYSIAVISKFAHHLVMLDR